MRLLRNPVGPTGATTLVFCLCLVVLHWLPCNLEAQTPAAASPLQPLVWPPSPEPTRIEFVHSFSRAGDFGWKRSVWRKFVDWAKNETDPSILRRPFAVAVDARGRLIVADMGAREVKIFDPEKKSVKVLTGYQKMRFGVPVSVAVDDQQNIYVSDSGAGRVLKYSRKGRFMAFIGGEEGAFKRPAAIAFHPGNRLLYVVDTVRPRIFAYTTDGHLVRQFGEPGNSPGQLNFPTFIAVDRAGRLGVNDTLNFRIQFFSADGKFLGQFGKPGDGSGNINRPKGVAFDSDGHLYVAEALFASVQIFDADGKYLLSFGQTGPHTGEFYIPAGVTVDSSDRIYVADPFQGRVQVFRYFAEQRAQAHGVPRGGR